MNREIPFRGKRQGSTLWVLGFYNEFASPKTGEQEYFIQTVKPDGRIDVIHKVEPETVGQYTGLTDKNGTNIFEGDILNIGEHNPAVNGRYLVIYDTANHCWALKRSEEYHHHYFTFSDLNGFAESSEVVGNIHDNPELLREGNHDN